MPVETGSGNGVQDPGGARGEAAQEPALAKAGVRYYTDPLKFLDGGVVFHLGHGSISGTSYGADEAGAQATAQSERTKPVLVANRFHAISQASKMSAKLRNTELASQWLRR